MSYEYEKKKQEKTIQRKKSDNKTGIPNAVRQRFEQKSGFSFEDVKVHYNSDKPAQMQALAYTQGNQVYVGPGQEKHLGHELGHVVQQKEGRVSANTSMNGMPVNNEKGLEQEADTLAKQFKYGKGVVQCLLREANPQNPRIGFIQSSPGIAGEAEIQNKANHPNRKTGSAPSVNPVGWDTIPFGIRGGGNWVRFHLINNRAGGPGNNVLNLVPTDASTNHRPVWNQFEEALRDNYEQQGNWIWCKINVAYHPGHNGFPSNIQGEAKYHDGASWNDIPDVNMNVADPNFGGATDYYLDQMTPAAWHVVLPGASEVLTRALCDLDVTGSDMDEFADAISQAISHSEFPDLSKAQERSLFAAIAGGNLSVHLISR